jgi:hypothetical protein
MDTDRILNEFMNELTPEEKEALSTATPTEILKGVTDALTDTEFWSHMGTSFLNGLSRGLSEKL